MAPEYMTEPLDETPSGTVDFAAVDRVLDIKTDVIAVGPGLGQSEGTAAFVQALLERAEVPLVLDADALNAFAGDPERLMGRDGRGRRHYAAPGEMARLLNISTEAVQHDWLRHAREFAVAHRVHVVLKGHRTIIAAPDGLEFVNLTGNAGMATGGTGDLLTGMVAAWFAQLLDAEAGVQASRLSARHRWRPRRGGRRGSRARRWGYRIAPRRRRPRAHCAAKVKTPVVTADSLATTAEEETVAAGERFARTLAPGAVILLYGQLGAGKTAFVRGIARGLGAAADEVSSPTFTIIPGIPSP